MAAWWCGMRSFRPLCTLTAHRQNDFYPWEVVFTAFNGSNQGTKTKQSVLGVASLNILELTSAEQEIELQIPLLLPGAAESNLSLHLALSILELRSQDFSDTVQNSLSCTSSPRSGDVNVIPPEKEELSALKSWIEKGENFNRNCLLSSEGKCSARSDDVEYGYPFDTNCLDDLDEVEDIKEDTTARNSFSYGTLASVNNMLDTR